MKPNVLRRTSFVLFALAASALGCTEEPTNPGQLASPAQDRSVSQTLLGQDIARGLSAALQASNVRATVLQAFRASPYVEHKLVLQEFIATPVGRQVLAAASSALSVTPDSLKAQINALPLLDLYVLGRAARKSWRGENNLAVALTTDMREAPAMAFTTAGAVPFQAARTSNVVLLLHPAEVKGFRANPQSSARGGVIQDETDGEIGVQVIRYFANGDSAIYDYQRDDKGQWVRWNRSSASVADGGGPLFGAAPLTPRLVIEPCESCGGGGGGSAPSTNVVYIRARSVCDMDCFAGNEFEFRGKERHPDGHALSTGTARVTGVDSGHLPSPYYQPWFGSVPVIFATANGDGRYMDIRVVETDPWPNPDDQFEPSVYLYSASDKNRDFHIGDNRTWDFCTRGEPGVPRVNRFV